MDSAACSGAEGRSQQRFERLWIVLLCLSTLAQIAFCALRGGEVTPDGRYYLSMARSLAHTGSVGLRIVELYPEVLGASALPSKMLVAYWPPGYPLVLLPAYLLPGLGFFGRVWLAYSISTVFALLTPWLIFALLRRCGVSTGLAALAGIASAWNISHIIVSTGTYSAVPFGFFLIAALWLISALLSGASGRPQRDAWLLFIAAAALCYLRYWGLTATAILTGATILLWPLHRSRNTLRAALALGLAAASFVPWLVRNKFLAGYFVHPLPGGTNDFFRNFNYAVGTLATALYPARVKLAVAAGALLWAAAAAVSLAGAWRHRRRLPRASVLSALVWIYAAATAAGLAYVAATVRTDMPNPRLMHSAVICLPIALGLLPLLSRRRVALAFSAALLLAMIASGLFMHWRLLAGPRQWWWVGMAKSLRQPDVVALAADKPMFTTFMGLFFLPECKVCYRLLHPRWARWQLRPDSLAALLRRASVQLAVVDKREPWPEAHRALGMLGARLVKTTDYAEIYVVSAPP